MAGRAMGRAFSLAASAAGRSGPGPPPGGLRIGCLSERPRLRETPRPRRACGSPRGVAPADEERAPPHAAGSGRTPPSRPPAAARRGYHCAVAGATAVRPSAPAGPSKHRLLSCPPASLSAVLRLGLR